MTPGSWEYTKLGDLFDITSSKRVFKSEWRDSGVPFYRAREIVKLAQHGHVDNDLYVSEEMYSEYSEKYGAPEPDDIMVTGVGTLGITYVVKEGDRFYFKDGNIVWFKSLGKCDSRFIQYALMSPKVQKHIQNSQGATVGTFTIVKAKNTKIPLPPLSEQRRLVGLLDAAFAGLATATAHTQKNLTHARELFDTHLNQVFMMQDESWDQHTLETLTTSDTPITYGVVKPGPKGDVPFVRGGDVKDGTIDVQNLRTITNEYSEQYKRTLLRGGELVVCLVGQPGQVGIVPMELAGANIARQVGLVRLDTNVDARFVCYFLRSPAGKEELGLYEGGSVQQVINLRDLKRVRIAIPNKATQEDVATRCETLEGNCDKLAANATAKLAALEELKQSLLHRAFRGELSGSILHETVSASTTPQTSGMVSS